MTTTEQHSREQPVNDDTVAARRHDEPLAETHSPRQVSENHVNGSEIIDRAAAADSPARFSDEFAQSQRAGLAAIMSLGKSRMQLASLPKPGPRAADSESFASPNGIASSAAAAPTQEPQEPESIHRSQALAYVPVLSLLALLTIQAVMSLRLVGSNSAEQDEALYLWAGHLEWQHWLHGTPMPPFATFFSGSPVVYPPIGALADSIGGLTGARILSLCFMLGATSLLWSTAARLLGRRAAFFAAALWASLGPTLYLGAFATYDALSLFLIVTAAWCVVRAGTHRDVTKWLLAASAALVLANAAKYATAIFDPVVVALAVVVAHPNPGGKHAIMRGAALVTYTTGTLVLLVTLGGGYYYTGIAQTTLMRSSVGNTASSVLHESWSLIGILVSVAVLGVIICLLSRSSRQLKLTIILLAAAGLLVPAEQARIHTLTSLNKHVDFGAWFAAIAAAYTAETVMRLTRSRSVQLMSCAICAAALIIPARLGLTQSRAIYTWPDSSQFINTFRPIVRTTTGRLLVETPYLSESELSAGQQWERWSNTRSIRLPSGRTISVPVNSEGNPSVYARFIKEHYFAVIALNFQATLNLDSQLASVLANDHSYRIVATAPFGRGRYIIWRYEPSAGTQ